MITLKLQGRLGNQMFQYAFAKSLQKKYYEDEELLINESSYNGCDSNNGWENSLKYFKIGKFKTTPKLNLNLFQYFLLYSYILIRKVYRMISKRDLNIKDFELKFTPFLNKFGIYCLNTGYYNFKKSKFKNKLILGCFESDLYFNEIENEIKILYTPVEALLEKNRDFFNKIIDTNSVCISIRRGDFTSDKFKKKFLICDEKYFEDAIKIILKRIPNPTFFIFSDDIEWVKSNMVFPSPCYYESEGNPVWEKLRLMYSCKNFIISNSTFSWWTQYLSNNKNKVVIAPNRWSNVIEHKDIFQKNWILVNVDREES